MKLKTLKNFAIGLVIFPLSIIGLCIGIALIMMFLTWEISPMIDSLTKLWIDIPDWFIRIVAAFSIILAIKFTYDRRTITHINVKQNPNRYDEDRGI